MIDGDTFEARVHVWPGLDITTKVRLRGIDAAELRARCPAERAKAEAARDALSAMFAEGSVGVFDVALDKYGGRVVADARTRSIANVSSRIAWARPRPSLRRRAARKLVRLMDRRARIDQRVTTTCVP